eukprot:2121640-Prymnesium_polylepis.1
MQAFDPVRRVWDAAPSMSTSRFAHAAVVLDNRLYVLGGASIKIGEMHTLSSVEVFDPTRGVWEEAPAMGARRAGLAAAALSGKIYVFGGLTKALPNAAERRLSSVEVFDPVRR